MKALAPSKQCMLSLSIFNMLFVIWMERSSMKKILNTSTVKSMNPHS